MRVTLNWLREFAPLRGDAEEVAALLDDLGLAVEERWDLGGPVPGVVVARVLEVRAHPDADRIRLVDVDAGDGEALQIACGASNMAAGDLVALATVGTTMPDGMEIAARRMRGEMSNGMLCSSRELRLGDDHGGILILPGDLSPGTPLEEALGLVADTAFDLDVLPNRPDALSVAGVARDLAARQGVPFEIPEPAPAVAGADALTAMAVDVLDPVLCGRFVARVLSGVRVGPSPWWLAQRLLAAGMRPINNVVDVSNYVMLELGQPNHTYDLALVAGGRLRVRRANEGECLVTLDGVERELRPTDGVIADGDDRAVGLAGVMGGASTEISETTSEVLLELAWWDPMSVALTSAAHNLHSEASLRFKRGTDPELPPLAAARFAEVLGAVAGTQLRPGVIDVEGDRPHSVSVAVRTSRVNAVLGTDLSRDDIASLLEPIGFRSVPDGPDDLTVTIPTFRPDATGEIDVVEEVSRLHGLSRLGRTVPTSPHVGRLTAEQRGRRAVRRALLAAGLDEAMPMPFLAPGDLERCGLPATGLVLANPLATEESVLRTSLLPGLLGAVVHNVNHRNPGVGLYELGRVFEAGAGVVVDVAASAAAGRVLDGEREQLGVVLAGREAPAAVELLDQVVAIAGVGPLALRPEVLPGLHPGRSAVIELAGSDAGQVGEVHPDVLAAWGIDERVAWLQLELSQLLALPARVVRARSVSRFPSTDIDLAFVVGDLVPAAAVRATILSTAGDLLRRLELFDVFRSEALGEGRRSLAFRLRFQADDRTLTDAEVAEVRAAVIDEVTATHGAELRA
ncbi:MAG: phenylalanine--tRNA ligase subunit beta [Microthrixaceae bacterium]